MGVIALAVLGAHGLRAARVGAHCAQNTRGVSCGPCADAHNADNQFVKPSLRLARDGRTEEVRGPHYVARIAHSHMHGAAKW